MVHCRDFARGFFRDSSESKSGRLYHNILFDSDRCWLPIDPNGVIGEIKYQK
jgi:streptomycin 6-kinase